MSAEYKSHMLKCIAMEPRKLLFFTEGEACLRISARHVERYAAELADEGLIFRGDDRYFITDVGRAVLHKPPSTASTRIWGSCSTQGSYVPKKWQVRAGADQHLQFLSRGTGV